MRKLLFKVIRLLTFDYYPQRAEKNRLVIFMFHQVSDKRNTFYPAMSVAAFRDLCTYIKKNFAVVPVSQIEQHFSKTNNPAAIISFDDGHYDIVKYALPVLKELNLPFNVNIDTEILETGKPQDFVRVYDVLNSTTLKSYMNEKYMQQPIVVDRNNPIHTENEFTSVLSNLSAEQKREVTEDLAKQAGMKQENYSAMLSKEDVKALTRENVEFGSHSHTHSVLTKISDDQLQHELKHSKEILESLIGKKVDILAYPNGVFNDTVREKARSAGYRYLLETDDKINNISPELLAGRSFKRVNQYHQTVDEALAHTFGAISFIKKLKG